MSAVDPARRARGRWHAPEKGSGPAFALSLLAHAVLFIAIAFMVRWKTEAPAPVSAELWTLPPAAVVQPTPPPRPVPVEIPPPPPPEPRKAEIVIEQNKVLPPPKPVPSKVEEKKVVPPEPPKKNDTKALEAKKAQIEAAQLEAARQDAVKVAMARAQAQAGPQASNAGGTGLSNTYRAQIVSCIRPHIIFNVPDAVRPQQYVADFEVVLLPTGEQAGAPRLVKSSGLSAYDQAVERAIRRCDPFPPPKEGTMPRSVRLSFDPVEMR